MAIKYDMYKEIHDYQIQLTDTFVDRHNPTWAHAGVSISTQKQLKGGYSTKTIAEIGTLMLSTEVEE